MDYSVRLGKENDLEQILAVIDSGRKQLASRNIPQWRNNEGPNKAVIMTDLQLEEGYVLLEDKEIVGYGTITKGKQEGYEPIKNGEWLGEEAYVSLHRIAIKETIKERGKGQFLLSYLILEAQKQGYTDIRIDTHPLNIPMQKVIQKAGFNFRGEIVLPVTAGERLGYQL
ncbi:GNAT family N-acetyltransferase [Vagococcus sp. DIV0080]|uniref:GNAT family N-acetyltransferase n=1 Tax=Candidatus Vagococcus giribetii TaxID=2230876 RepID=A0ABS3HQR9_9ENTE|nr:GNAT family N-acetyltransferase [Vagococcus sp. DIV0080]MBO0476093.1 GNAT family N-acetyltransferase [Vagococcus sp. DIV0080]